MAVLPIENLNIETQQVLLSPDRLKAEIPMSPTAAQTVSTSRGVIRDILDGKIIACLWWSVPALSMMLTLQKTTLAV